MTIAVTLNKLENATPGQETFIRRACGLLQQAINHPRFAERMSQATYKESRHEDAQGNDSSVPREKVIEYVLAGRESGAGDDGEIDLHIVLAKLRSPGPFWGGVVGKTALGKPPIRTGRWFVMECMAEDDPASLARHFIHEWLHVAGFYHYPTNSARDDVPYVVGDIVQKVLTEDMGAGLRVSPKLAEQVANSPH